MRDNNKQTVKIELLSQWKLEAEFRNMESKSIKLVKLCIIKCTLGCIILLKQDNCEKKLFDPDRQKNVNVFILKCEEDTMYLIMNNHWRATYNYSGARLLRGVALLLLLRVTRLLLRGVALLLQLLRVT